MCWIEHVYHKPCRHWGCERFAGEPCIRSKVLNGRHTGCGYVEDAGSVSVDEYCPGCKYRRAQTGEEWMPFAKISSVGWARVEEKIRQRSMGLELARVYVGNNKSVLDGRKKNTDFSCRAEKMTGMLM